MNFKLCLFVLCIYLFTRDSYANSVLCKTQKISVNHVEELARHWSTLFTWHYFSKTLSVSFYYEKEQAGFALKLRGIPFYCHNYRLLPTIDEIKRSLTFNSYYLDKPLYSPDANPKILLVKDCIRYIRNKKCIFYTGAGLSAAANVFTMKDLELSLCMHQGLAHFLKNAWHNAPIITKAFTAFCKAALSCQPTQAHKALQAIAEKHNICVITENVDLLQQRTGINPLPVGREEVITISAHELKEVDCVICIGLSCDNRGFLAKYKSSNPNGILIAIDLRKPSYLSDNDYIVYGDIQKIVPAMLEE